MSRPLCPRCGCPARYVTGKATVRIRLTPEGELGDVERVSHVMELPEPEYVCGMEHRWKLTTAES